MPFILIGLSSFLILLFLFANIMWLKKHADKLPRPIYYILYAIGYTVFILDIIWNIIFGTVLFMQLPHKDRLTLTHRMKYILITDDGWRFKLAHFICKYIIEPWDWNHCGLSTK